MLKEREAGAKVADFGSQTRGSETTIYNTGGVKLMILGPFYHQLS